MFIASRKHAPTHTLRFLTFQMKLDRSPSGKGSFDNCMHTDLCLQSLIILLTYLGTNLSQNLSRSQRANDDDLNADLHGETPNAAALLRLEGLQGLCRHFVYLCSCSR